MSESVTTRSKTATDTLSSDSSEDNAEPEPSTSHQPESSIQHHRETSSPSSQRIECSLCKVPDRWTNNITYRQLVTSSCIGILQFWWQPYAQRPEAFIPYLFVYNMFSLFLGFPLFYFELAIGIVTRKSVLRSWDMAPAARGIGWVMLTISMFTAFALGIVSAYCLSFTVHSAHAFLPWLHCAAGAKPPCAARHRPLPPDSETPAQSFFHNYVLDLKRDGIENGLGSVVTELAVYYVITWITVYFIAIKKIYSYSKLLLFKDGMAMFVIACSVIAACNLKGAQLMFTKCDWNVLLKDPHIWRRAVEYCLIEMTISQGSLIMLGSYCPKSSHKLSHTAMIGFIYAKTVSLGSAFVLGATNGALYTDYGFSSNITTETSAYSLVLWSDFVARVPGSQFWSAIIFFTLFVLTVTNMALLVQTVISTFTGKIARKISWVFLILICLFLCFTGIFTLCTQGGIYLLDFLIYWPVSMPRIPIAAMTALIVTYIYGQTTFCEDLFLTIGEYPNVFLRICWALCPGVLLGMSFAGVGYWPENEKVAGWILNVFMLMPIFIVFACYTFFRCRVRNITGSEK